MKEFKVGAIKYVGLNIVKEVKINDFESIVYFNLDNEQISILRKDSKKNENKEKCQTRKTRLKK